VIKLSLEKHKTPAIVPLYRQKRLPFYAVLPVQPLSPRSKELSPEPINKTLYEVDRAKELLLDALIGESCGVDNALETPMTIQEVFDSV
jgi:hypothetical protein